MGLTTSYNCGELGGVDTVDTFTSDGFVEVVETGIFCETAEACGAVTGVCVIILLSLFLTIGYLWFRDFFRDEDKPERVPKCIFNAWGWIQIITILLQEIIAFQLTSWTHNVFWSFFGLALFMAAIDGLAAFLNKWGTFFHFVSGIGIIGNAVFLCYTIYEAGGVWTFGSRMIFATSATIQVVCEHNMWRADKAYEKAASYQKTDGVVRGKFDEFNGVMVGIAFDVAYGIFIVPIAYLRLDSPWKSNAFGYFCVVIAWLGMVWHEWMYTLKYQGVGIGIKSYTVFILINVLVSVVILIMAITYLPNANRYREMVQEEEENGTVNAGCHVRTAEMEWRIHIGLIVWCIVFDVICIVWWYWASNRKRKKNERKGRNKISDRDDPYRL